MSITIGQFYDHITKHMTAEEALKLLLSSSLITYKKLKFDEEDTPVHPLFVMTMAALDLGWGMAMERSEDGQAVEGISFGTNGYFSRLFDDNPEFEKLNGKFKNGDTEQYRP